jgi:hypothetical protein
VVNALAHSHKPITQTAHKRKTKYISSETTNKTRVKRKQNHTQKENKDKTQHGNNVINIKRLTE